MMWHACCVIYIELSSLIPKLHIIRLILVYAFKDNIRVIV